MLSDIYTKEYSIIWYITYIYFGDMDFIMLRFYKVIHLLIKYHTELWYNETEYLWFGVESTHIRSWTYSVFEHNGGNIQVLLFVNIEFLLCSNDCESALFTVLLIHGDRFAFKFQLSCRSKFQFQMPHSFR